MGHSWQSDEPMDEFHCSIVFSGNAKNSLSYHCDEHHYLSPQKQRQAVAIPNQAWNRLQSGHENPTCDCPDADDDPSSLSGNKPT
jgi:hypothetical protein